MTAINFGVCGVGRIGAQHCRCFAQNPEHYRLVAACDADPGRVAAVTAELGGKGHADFARPPVSNPQNARLAQEMIHGIYAAHLSGMRTTFPLASRKHPLEL